MANGPFLGLIGLAALSVILASVEHGWQTLSRARLAESGTGPDSRERIERMLERGDDVESSLLVLRVACQVALAMTSVVVLNDFLPSLFPTAHLGHAVTTAGIAVFVWIALFCRVLPDELRHASLARLVRVTMPVVVVIAIVLGPPVQLLRRLLRRITGHTDEAEKELYADEILSTVEEGEREGHIKGDQADMIESVLELSDTEVHKHMTPRTDVDVIDVGASIGEATRIACETGRSRYPLVDGDVDRVVGVLHVKDLLQHEEHESVETCKRPPYFVPESKYCAELLAEFRKQRAHIAVVLDEYGGTAGIITIEDVLEEIVGEIDDEFDTEEDDEELKILDSHHAVAPGTIHVDELNEALGISLPESDDWSTLGGFIFSTLGRLPAQDEVLRHDNVQLRVDRVEDRRVDRVTIEIFDTAA